MVEKEKKKKRKSLSRRVIGVTILLAVQSFLAVSLNSVALKEIQGYANRYNSYLAISKYETLINTKFVEAKMYANLSYFNANTESAAENLQLLREATSALQEHCTKMDELSAGLQEVTSSKSDEELIGAVTSWTGQLKDFSNVLMNACANAENGNYDDLNLFLTSEPQYRSILAAVEATYQELKDARVANLEYHSGIKVVGTEVFNYILLGIITLLSVFIVILLYVSLAKPVKNSQNKTKEIIDKLQSGNGDLTERVPVKANDEVGALSDGINQVMG